MNATVIPLRPKTLAALPAIVEAPAMVETLALNISIPRVLAESIRLSAAMHGKNPEQFVLNWLKSGFPEEAA